ncbi:MAG: TldD/PmbA family protein [Isosphaerales bacterium]
MTMGWTKEQARALADRVLSFSRAADCEVFLGLSKTGHTRFAANQVTTAGSAETLSISITSREGGRSGSTSLDFLDDDAVKGAVARSEELMAAARPDPEAVEALGPQKYLEIDAFDEETAHPDPVKRRDGVKKALDRARAERLTASGFFETSARWSALANKKGNFGFHRSTSAEFSTTMRTAEGTGSGYAAFEAPRLAGIDPSRLVEIAASKAVSSSRPRDLEPGRYTVILEPQAVSELLFPLIFSLNARTSDEGRSFLSKPGGGTKLGEKLFADGVTLRSDPTDPRVPGSPWTGGGRGGGLGFGGFGGGGSAGLPSRKTTWIENGVVKALSVDRFWAVKTKTDPVPFSGSLVMEGSSRPVEELIAQTERGLLVTRFWYIRVVNPQNATVTGLTRDGVWLIEKGKIAYPVNNFRFNESPINLLKNLEATSVPTTANRMVVPAIKSNDFLFTSRSDAV